MRRPRPGRSFLFPAYYALFAALIFAYGGLTERITWDLIPYVACAREIAKPGTELQAWSYAEVRKVTSEPTYAALVDGEDYRRVLAADPVAFAETLAFYRVRVIHNGLIAALGAAGFGYARAGVILPALAAGALVVLLYFAARGVLPRPVTLALPVLTLLLGLHRTARAATPDALAALVLVAAAWAFLRGRKVAMWLAVLAVLVRTDLLGFSLCLCVAGFFLTRRWVWLGAALASALLVPALGRWAGYPSLQTVFYQTRIGLVAHPITAGVSLTPGDYLSALRAGTKSLLLDGAFQTFVCALLLWWGMRRGRVGRIGWTGPGDDPTADLLGRSIGGTDLAARGRALVLVSIVSFALHFLLLPDPWERYFVGIYLCGVLGAGATITGAVECAKRPRDRG